MKLFVSMLALASIILSGTTVFGKKAKNVMKTIKGKTNFSVATLKGFCKKYSTDKAYKRCTAYLNRKDCDGRIETRMKKLRQNGNDMEVVSRFSKLAKNQCMMCNWYMEKLDHVSKVGYKAAYKKTTIDICRKAASGVRAVFAICMNMLEGPGKWYPKTTMMIATSYNGEGKDVLNIMKYCETQGSTAAKLGAKLGINCRIFLNTSKRECEHTITGLLDAYRHVEKPAIRRCMEKKWDKKVCEADKEIKKCNDLKISQHARKTDDYCTEVAQVMSVITKDGLHLAHQKCMHIMTGKEYKD